MYEILPPTPHYKYTCTTVSSPPNSVAGVLNLSGCQILRSQAPPRLQIPAAPPPTTFEAYIQCPDQWEYYLLHDSTINTDVFCPLETIQNNHQIIAASDDLSLLLSDPMAGSAPYLMASVLPPTMDQISAVRHHPSAPRRTDSSLTSNYTALANTLTPPYPRKLSSTLTLPV